MLKKKETNTRQLQPDFPLEPILGSFRGAQPKLLLKRGSNGTYDILTRSREEIFHRFTCADDLADQLETYFNRKKIELPESTDEKNYERIGFGLKKTCDESKWVCTEAEKVRIMGCLRERTAS